MFRTHVHATTRQPMLEDTRSFYAAGLTAPMPGATNGVVTVRWGWIIVRNVPHRNMPRMRFFFFEMRIPLLIKIHQMASLQVGFFKNVAILS